MIEPVKSPSPSQLRTLGVTAVAMLGIAALFYLRSMPLLPSSLERGFIAALCLAAALPYAWVLGNLLARRDATALLAGLACAVIYLLAFGWVAVLLVLLSWGDVTLWLPAAGLPVQLVALVVAFAGWRRLELQQRAAASRGLAIGVPVAICGAMLLLAVRLESEVKQAPQRRQAQLADGEQLVGQLQQCLIASAAHTGRGYPARLADLSSADAACTLAVARATGPLPGAKLRYVPAPADREQQRTTFWLCLQPTSVPDAGIATIVADHSGIARRVLAREGARRPVPCAEAWAGSMPGAVKQLQTCALEYAAQASGQYPPSLETLARALPECLGPPEHLESRTEHSMTVRVSGPGEVGRMNAVDELTIRYLAGPPDADGAIRDYQLFVTCVGQDASAIIDSRGVVQESAAARRWLAGCADPQGSDAALLAQQAGFRLERPAPAAPPAVPLPPEAAPEAATGRIEPEPQFGDNPDLPGWRRECREHASACYGLGRELERTVRIGGATPERYAELTAPQQALVHEANEGFERACGAGASRACAALADVVLDGRGVASDPPRALELYGRSCDAGLTLACTRRAELHESGYTAMRTAPLGIAISPSGAASVQQVQRPDPAGPGIDKDLRLAVLWHRKACLHGEISGCFRAARLTLESDPVTPSERDRALAEYQALCKQGVSYACAGLARWAADHGGRVGSRTADEWQRRACVLGSAEACR